MEKPSHPLIRRAELLLLEIRSELVSQDATVMLAELRSRRLDAASRQLATAAAA